MFGFASQSVSDSREDVESDAEDDGKSYPRLTEFKARY